MAPLTTMQNGEKSQTKRSKNPSLESEAKKNGVRRPLRTTSTLRSPFRSAKKNALLWNWASTVTVLSTMTLLSTMAISTISTIGGGVAVDALQLKPSLRSTIRSHCGSGAPLPESDRGPYELILTTRFNLLQNAERLVN